MQKIDPYKNKEKFENWKNKGSIIPNISRTNSKLIREFIFDMEEGTNINTSNKKGSRSYIRLNAYRFKLKLFAECIEKYYKKNFPQLTKKDFNKIITDMDKGIIKRKDGKTYTNVSDYLKSFKAFWHWLQKTHKTKLEDITIEAEADDKKPAWVYLDLKQFKKLADNCKPYYKLLAYFCLDASLRVTELKNTRVSNFYDDFKQLEITDEVSKTIGRKIRLMMVSDMIREYVKENNLKDDDLLFKIDTSRTNQYYKRVAYSLFGEKKSLGKEYYKNISLADFRHISACYWLPRYPTQQGMMYRFGWKKADKVFYYSEFLGMKDNIQEEHMLIDVTKTELQQKNEKLKDDFELFKESSEKEILDIKSNMKKIQKVFTLIPKETLVDIGNKLLKKAGKEGKVEIIR